MNAKLTLKLDAMIIEKTKKYAALRGVSLSLADGTLHVACGGPAADYVQDPAAMGEEIKKLLP